MYISLALQLIGLAAAVSAQGTELFYGKNGLSKLLAKNVATEKNCGCNGTWDSSVFADISNHFGAELAQAIQEQKASGDVKLGPLSVGGSDYTLSGSFSEDFVHSEVLKAGVWSKLINDMLVVGDHRKDESIITAEFVNTLGGAHTLTLAVYGDATCSGAFKPCEKAFVKARGEESEHSVGPGLDWSDAEAVKNAIDFPTYNSTSFHQLIISNATLPEFVYLEDSNSIVDTSTVKTDGENKLHSRQFCPTTSYSSYSFDGAWSQWGNWLPISNCLYTGLSPSGGSVSFTYGYSLSFAQSFGWDGSKIVAVFPSFSFSITQAYSNSNTYGCNVPGNSVGQVWFQNLNGYGYAYKTDCVNHGACGVVCGGRQGPNYVGAPGNRVSQFGCSTGYSNVRCDKYNNWAGYSVWSQV
ncbi:hypothetical protein NQ176_g4060 [Zarea fungicola]|uniref:Uncharacterized protein n=1 Tax=Zarea fungicola TaxID=93591 RepID=A0ACC1NFE8_9HYPO|nr:hypothetical protein NQ176_g4060 [Lecanicillium fungicola]